MQMCIAPFVQVQPAAARPVACAAHQTAVFTALGDKRGDSVAHTSLSGAALVLYGSAGCCVVPRTAVTMTRCGIATLQMC